MGTVILNKQTGLYNQSVTVTNQGTGNTTTFQVLTEHLATGDTLYNKSGTTSAGIPYLQDSTPLAPGKSVVLLLEYYAPNRVAPTPVLALQF